MKIITVGHNDAGQRLDKFLSKAVKGLPTSLMYKFIRTKKIKVNRARTEQKYMLCEGDEIQLFIRDEFFASPEGDEGALYRITPKLDILYEDENIMLLNKRPGVLVHEDTAAAENTLTSSKDGGSIASLIDQRLADKKAVKNAIDSMKEGEFTIVDGEEEEAAEVFD